MKNFIAEGETIEVLAPSAVTSGQLVKVGTIFGVAKHSAASGAPVQLQREGIFSLPKAAGLSLAQGDIALWDGTKIVATGGDVIGSITQAASGGAATAAVLICGDVQEFTGAQRAALAATVSGAWKTCPNTLDASVTYETTQLSVAASQTVTLALAGVAALPAGGISLDVPAGGAGATLAFSSVTHDGSSGSIVLNAGYTYTVRPGPTAGTVYVTGGARL